MIPLIHCALAAPPASHVPDGFVDIEEVIPSIVLDIRYYTPHNFVGRPIKGYLASKCYLTKEAASALKKVQEELRKFSLSLKVYDCYRPQRAVDHFVEWAKEISDNKMKKEFYPTVNKENLFRDGFIASRSGHSRGSTVDLTIVPIPLPGQGAYVDGQQLCECYLPEGKRFKDNSIDLGTGYDCFSEVSWTDTNKIGPQQRANRLLLKTLMEKYGFRNYDKEWWHFTLRGEPFPDSYFDFVIK
ncbi:MAG: M15 family metallopeptidase [Pseudomonadota bacterium]